MGSRDWFKTIISKKKVKVDKPKQSKGSDKSTELKNKGRSQKKNANGKITSKSNGVLSKLSEDAATTRIQTAFRAYMARKTLRRMKGIVRFQKLTERKSVKKQSTSTLTRLHLWSRIQAEIRDHRLCKVTECRLKQKKLENQLKLGAKLHDLEVCFTRIYDRFLERERLLLQGDICISVEQKDCQKVPTIIHHYHKKNANIAKG